MTIRSAIRDQFRASTSEPAGDRDSQTSAATGDGGSLPFTGYDRLGERAVVDGLSRHSQIDLTAVEQYERSHKNRKSILDKLRYLRGPEPLPGYDALNVEEIVTALEGADVATIKRVRGYERKFAARSDLLSKAVHAQRERRAESPATTAPGYEPMSVTSR